MCPAFGTSLSRIEWLHTRAVAQTHSVLLYESLLVLCVACGRGSGVFVGFRFNLLDSLDACSPQVERVPMSWTHESQHKDHELKRMTVIGGNN